MIRKDNRNRDDSRGMRKESPRGKRTPETWTEMQRRKMILQIDLLSI